MDEDKAVAIIGIGCRFPGANNKEAFWELLLNCENHITEVRKHRPGFESYFVSDPNDPNLRQPYKAGLVDRFSLWENKVFGITDQEAKWIDPQQRFVLDCVHMAMEDAGITRKELNGTNTGVYIGAMNDDFKYAILEDADSEESSYMVTGLSLSIVSARVSYIYNLLGPSMTIDTACSSSLVAIHQGSLALRAGDCTMAICGGVNLLLDPRVFVTLANARMMSPSGQCHSFSSKADGYTRGEGCGIVLLKRAHDAIRDGNKIWGLIGTCVNQDGHMATPITAPSGEQQLALLRRIYPEYKVPASSVQVIEAHGTGTSIGDPTEANALGIFFNEDSSSGRKYIGSVKSNIGHLESAAGVAGLIKILLMMKNAVIVPSLHVKEEGLNTKNNLEKNRLIVPTESVEWTSLDNKRKVACVNSFGFGGTNAHAIVCEYIEQKPNDKSTRVINNEPVIVFISGITLDGLHYNVSKMLERLHGASYDLLALSFTSICKREHFPVRAGFVAKNQTDLAEKCKIFNATRSKDSEKKLKKKVVFVFCGVGTVWPGMCSKLSKKGVFASTLHEVDRLLKIHTGWSVVEKMMSKEIMTDPLIGHISIFTCQVCLFEMWKSFGVVPDCIVGQSVGEVAAAYASGAIGLETAVEIIYKRSFCLSKATSGRMMVVSGLDIISLENICQANNGSIAVHNSSVSATISGDAKCIEAIKRKVASLQETGNTVLVKELETSCAYHSCHVENAKVNFLESLSKIHGSRPSIPIVSTVTGDYVKNEDFTTASYWGRNIRETVQFSKAIRTSAEENGTTVFLEIGPRPVLAPHLKHILPQNQTLCLPSMKAEDDTISWRQTLVDLFQAGFNLEWESIVERANCLTDIPQYHFLGKVAMPPNGFTVATSHKSETSHLYVKQQQQVENKNQQYKIKIDGQEASFVFEHFVRGNVIVPGAMYADVGFEVGKCLFDKPVQDLEVELEFVKVLPVSISSTTEVFISVEKRSNPDGDSSYHFEAISHGQIRAMGQVKIRPETCYKRQDISDLKSKFALRLSKEDSYRKLRELGFTYGENFALLEECWTKPGECFAKLNVTHSIMSTLSKTHIHPVILDCMLQTSAFVLNEKNTPIPEAIQLFPIGIGSLRVIKSPRDRVLFSYLRMTDTIVSETLIENHTNIYLLDKDGYILVEVENFTILGKLPDVLIPRDLKYAVTTKLYHHTEADKTNGLGNIIFVQGVKATKDIIFSDSASTLSIQAKSIDTKFSDILLKTAIEKWGGMDQVSRVIFMPGSSIQEDETRDGMHLMAEIKRNCLIFKEIVKVVKDLPQQPPIFVITENTQGLVESLSTPISIHGSEMWGLIRCFLREMIYMNVYLLDIVSWIENEALLQSILSQSTESFKTFPLEIILNKMKLFVPQLQCAPNTEKQNRTRTTLHRSVEQVLLQTRDLNHPLDLYLIPNKTIPVEPKSGWINVEVDTIYLQDVDDKYSTFGGKNGSDIDIFNNGDHQVVSLEVTGYIQYADIQKSSFIGKFFRRCQSEIISDNEDYHGKAKVVVCYPMEIGSVVTVPISCVAKRDDVPNYFPGKLILAVQAQTLLQLLPRHQKIVVYTAQNDAKIAYMLNVLRSNGRSIEHLDFSNPGIVNHTQDMATTAVLLNPLEPEHEQSFLSHLQKCKNLICVGNHVRQTLKDMIEVQSNTKCTYLKWNNIFSNENLLRIVPKVITWLQEEKSQKTCQVDIRHSSQEPVIDLKSGLLKLELEKSNLFDKMSSYIVVGGLTGLGWVLLKLIAEMGAGVIATFSRRGNLMQKQSLIRELEENTGCEIICLKADVSNMKSLRQALVELNVRFPRHPVKGIFQGAGVIDSTLFLNLTSENFDTVMLPKVAGSWNLHLLSMNLPLNYFVLHSSIAGVLGAGGDSNYGAANTFLDTLAIYRRKKGLPGQSIAWGGLVVGMAAGDQFAKNFESKGYLRLDEDQIRECFLHALMQDLPHVVYTKVSWDLIALDHRKAGVNRLAYKIEPILRKKNLTIFEETTEPNGVPSIDWQVFWKVGRPEQLKVLTDIVGVVVSKVSNVDFSDLQPETVLSDGGIDSLAAIHFTNILSDIFKCRVPTGLTISPNTTIKVLAEFLLVNMDIKKILASRSEYLSHVKHQTGNGVTVSEQNGPTYTVSNLTTEVDAVFTKL